MNCSLVTKKTRKGEQPLKVRQNSVVLLGGVIVESNPQFLLCTDSRKECVELCDDSVSTLREIVAVQIVLLCIGVSVHKHTTWYHTY